MFARSADLVDLIKFLKMADVIITLKIMPESHDVDLKGVEEKARKLISDFGGEVGKVEIEPIAFGLNALKLVFVMDESKGDTESLEKDISELAGVVSVDVVDVRRAIG
jgi:elongation factor 1-beta